MNEPIIYIQIVVNHINIYVCMYGYEGITDSSNPCCLTWANGTSACVPALVPCPNVEKHYFWDGYHLTEAIYSALAKHCIEDNTFCIPMSIKQLVQT